MVNGGDSIAGDGLALTGAPGAVTVDLGSSAVTGYGGTVGYTGLESLTTAQSGAGG